MIHIYFTKFQERLPERLFEFYLEQIPVPLREKTLRYIRWQDRHACLFGKLLLLHALISRGFSRNVLDTLKYNRYGRPYMDGIKDFNISHSGEYVLCAISDSGRLGIDIEEIKEINFNDFTSVMTPEQWEDIRLSKESAKAFFRYWTIKESVIKADSRGMSIPLTDILVKDNTVSYDNKDWHLKELSPDRKYCACLASENADAATHLHEINFRDSEALEKGTAADFREMQNEQI